MIYFTQKQAVIIHLHKLFIVVKLSTFKDAICKCILCTQEQYLFIYDCVLEWAQCRDTFIPTIDFVKRANMSDVTERRQKELKVHLHFPTHALNSSFVIVN